MGINFKANMKAFVLDTKYGRVFPVIVESKEHVQTSRCSYYRYKVRLEMTPGVHDRLTFNGIAKPCPFVIFDDDWFSQDMLFESKVEAYQALVDFYRQRKIELQEELKHIPFRIEQATEALNQTAAAFGSKYKVGDHVYIVDWNGSYTKVVYATIKRFDRGDFQNKPFEYSRFGESGTAGWAGPKDIYKTKQAANKAVKAYFEKQAKEDIARACI